MSPRASTMSAANLRLEHTPSTLTERSDCLGPHGTERETALLEGVLDLFDFGTLILRTTGELVVANHVAVQECRSSGVLVLTQGFVEVRSDEPQGAFRQALECARRGLRSMLHVSACGKTRSIIVAPIAQPVVSQEQTPLCLVMLGRSYEGCRLALELFARSHALTVAETNVLRGLCRGASPRKLAQELKVAICTVRTHIGHIRQKTSHASIRELVAQADGLPPLAHARTLYSVSTEQSSDRAEA